MGAYEDRLENTAIADRVEGVWQVVTGLTPEQREQLDQGSPEGALRLEFLLDHVLTVTSTVNPQLVTQGALNNLTSRLQAVQQTIENFAGPDPSAVSSLAQHLDDLAAAVNALPGAHPTQQEITQAAETYRRSLGQRVVALTDDLNRTEAAVAELQKTHSELRASVESKQAEFGETVETRTAEMKTSVEAFNSLVQTRLDELQSEINAQKTRLDEALNQVQATFAETQKNRQEEFDELTKGSEERFKELVAQTTSDADAHMETLHGYEKEAADLLGVIAATGTAGHYKNEADEQKKIADEWRKYTIWLAGTAAVLALAFLVWAAFADLPIAFTLAKAATVVGLTGIAGYAARQSARHRHREETARRVEMELVAVGPFIEALDDMARNKVREELAPRLFGNPIPVVATPDAALTRESVSLLQQIADLLGLRPR